MPAPPLSSTHLHAQREAERSIYVSSHSSGLARSPHRPRPSSRQRRRSSCRRGQTTVVRVGVVKEACGNDVRVADGFKLPQAQPVYEGVKAAAMAA